jgi:hypothetical protein
MTAIEQAIEALESCTDGDYSSGHVIHPHFDRAMVDAALAALRAQPDLESRDFYELMQAYRLEPWDAAAPFEAVKAWLRNPTYEWGEQ